jgi:nucleoside-diphosphate-sugar epimerase
VHILVTGATGFIGFHLARANCGGHNAKAIDGMTLYCDRRLNEARRA